MAYQGDRLVLPNNRAPPAPGTPLADLFDCYRIWDLSRITSRASHTDTWKQHAYKTVCFTAKGAGGTGKTTNTWTAAYSLLSEQTEEDKVLVVNADSQPSLEERALSKVVHAFYNDDLEAFHTANNLINNLDANLGPINITTLLGSLLTSGKEIEPYRFTIKPPKVLSVDPVRLSLINHYASERRYEPVPPSEKRIFVMLGDENISEWEEKIAQALTSLRPTDMERKVPGTFASLMKITAYKLGLSHVFIDLGPGNGLLNRNVIMSSSGFFLPLGIDNKCFSTITSFANKLPIWKADYEFFQQWSSRGGPINYSMPDGMPKFLGIIFSGLGARGEMRPNNQYAALVRCYSRLNQQLLPVLQQHNMSLGVNVYDQIINTHPSIDGLVSRIGTGACFCPPAQPGTAAILRVFDQLAYIAERESVPVPYLEDYHMFTIAPDAYDAYVATLMVNPQAPVPPDHEFLKPIRDRRDLLNKVANVRGMVKVYLRAIQACPFR